MSSVIQAGFESWSSRIPINSALALVLLVYVRGWFRLRRTLPAFTSGWRFAAFMGGLFTLWLAIASPLQDFDDELLSIHMAQHILLMIVSPPLILLGAPTLPMLHGLPRSFVRGPLSRLLRYPPVAFLGHVVTNPLFCWLAAMIALIAWHIPAVFEFALRSEAWHHVEHACFFVTSLLFWWPVVQPWPARARWPRWSIPLYLFLGMVVNDAPSAFLAFSDHVLYPSYAVLPRLLNIAPLNDQAFAGALMWVFGTFVYLVPAIIITVQLLDSAASSVRMQGPATAGRIARALDSLQEENTG